MAALKCVIVAGLVALVVVIAAVIILVAELASQLEREIRNRE